MLGIKKSTVNQKQLSLITSDRLARHVIASGTTRQKKELCRFLSDIALYQISASGTIIIGWSYRLDVLVHSIMGMFKAFSGLASMTSGPLQIDLPFYNNNLDDTSSMTTILLQQSLFLHNYYTFVLLGWIDV